MTERAAVYTIEVGGHLGPGYAAWFEGMTVRAAFAGAEPITVLHGSLRDQAALYGVLGKLQALNIPLRSLHRLGEA